MSSDLPQANPERSSQRLRILIFGLFFAGLFSLSLGIGMIFLKGSTPDDEIQIISSEDSQSGSEIVVHVAGAVVAPGVHRLSADSRVSDAVEAAGGLTDQADTSRINLAAKISDGQKVYIFAIGEPALPAGRQGTSDKGQVTSQTSNLININTASEKELDTLPGVGPVTAGKIIASRPYSAPEELLTKKVVNGSVYEKIKELITTY